MCCFKQRYYSCNRKRFNILNYIFLYSQDRPHVPQSEQPVVTKVQPTITEHVQSCAQLSPIPQAEQIIVTKVQPTVAQHTQSSAQLSPIPQSEQILVTEVQPTVAQQAASSGQPSPLEKEHTEFLHTVQQKQQEQLQQQQQVGVIDVDTPKSQPGPMTRGIPVVRVQSTSNVQHAPNNSPISPQHSHGAKFQSGIVNGIKISHEPLPTTHSSDEDDDVIMVNGKQSKTTRTIDEYKPILDAQPTVLLAPLNIGGRERVWLQSIEEEVSRQERKTLKSKWLQGICASLPNENVKLPMRSELKRPRSASEVKSSGQIFLTATPTKQRKKSRSSEAKCISENNTSDKEQSVIVIESENGSEIKSMSPNEKSRSLEMKYRSAGAHHNSKYGDQIKNRSSAKDKHRSNKDKSGSRSADLEVHSNSDSPGLKLLVRSKSTSYDPYDFEVSQVSVEESKNSENKSENGPSNRGQKSGSLESGSGKSEGSGEENTSSGSSPEHVEEMDQDGTAGLGVTFKVPRYVNSTHRVS